MKALLCPPSAMAEVSSPPWLHFLLVALGVSLLIPLSASAATNIVLWDSIQPFAETLATKDISEWKAIPTELFIYEADPPKAASDPGYYGREYHFTGDPLIENEFLTAVFWSAKGRVVLIPKSIPARPNESSPTLSWINTAPIEIIAFHKDSPALKMTRCEIVHNAGDDIILEVFWNNANQEQISAIFAFGRDEIVEIKPTTSETSFSLSTAMEYAILPSFIGDDLILGAKEWSSGDSLFLPNENLLLGLTSGGNSQIVMTWPHGSQQLRLQAPTPKTTEGSSPVSLHFNPDQRSFYLAPLQAKGIWHREKLKASYLEKDVPIDWIPPFPAKWKTQLSESKVPTTFSFRHSRDQIWRGVPGSYIYPVWFDNGKTYYHLSKKVLPKGDSLIYHLESQNTPVGIATPVDILRRTLGRQESSKILDLPGRKLRTHHRRGGDGVHRACTCGYTEAIQTFFESGQEVQRKKEIEEALDDMIFFVEQHVERIEEYQQFAAQTLRFLQEKGASHPNLKTFLNVLEATAQEIQKEHTVQKENMKSLQHASNLKRLTLSLTASVRTQNLADYMELLNSWRAMGGAQDYVLAQCHVLTRRLFQEAGYGGALNPEAVSIAQEIRRRCRQILRNPDGYEIWADY